MNISVLKEKFEKSKDKYADSKAIGTTYQTMYNIIYKGSVPKADLLKSISDYYKIPILSFFGENTNQVNVGHYITGNNDSITGNISVGNQEMIDNLKKEIELKDQIIKEKERLINVLMNNK